MSNRLIKFSKDHVKKEIEDQITKGGNLLEIAKKIFQLRSQDQNRLTDNFKIDYQHWEDLTFEKLNEIFESNKYAHEFQESKSSQDYYGSGWSSTLDWYIGDKLIPKLDYLQSILRILDEFLEIKVDNKSKEKTRKIDKKTVYNKSLTSDDIDKLTFGQFLKILSIKQIFGIVGTLIIIISGSFYLGYNIYSWKRDRNYSYQIDELQSLKKENILLKQQIKSLNNSHNQSNTDTSEVDISNHNIDKYIYLSENQIRIEISKLLKSDNIDNAIKLVNLLSSDEVKDEEYEHIFNYCLKNDKLDIAEKVANFYLSSVKKDAAKKIIMLEKLKKK